MGDEDDPVVAKYKLFIRRRNNDENPLYVLQNVNLTREQLDGENLKSCRIKPKQQKIELELGLNTGSESYDSDRAEQIASLVDGPCFESKAMDCITFASTNKMQMSQFAVGALHGDEIHLNPVSGLLQMNQKLTYMDLADANAKSKATDDEEKEEASKIIAPKFETERSLVTKMKTYAYLQKQLDEEPWTKLVFHGSNTELATDDFHNLFCQSRDPSLTSTPDDLSQTLVGQGMSKAKAKTYHDTPFYCLKSLTLHEKVKTLMNKAKVLSYFRLKSLLEITDKDEPAVFIALKLSAFLVQGCWVVSSEQLYPKGTISSSGQSAEVLCKARDYILWKLSKKRTIVRTDIHAATGLVDNDLVHILKQIATVNSQREWEFLLPTDQEFIQKYPDVVAEETKKFERIEQSWSLSLLANPVKRQRRRTKSQRESDDEKEVIDVTPMEVTPLSDEELSPAVLEALKTFINDELDRNKVCTLNYLKSAMSCNATLNGISDTTLIQNLIGQGATRLETQWPPERLPELLFAKVEVGDDMDDARKELFNIFKTGSFKHRRSYIKKRLDSVIPKTISDFDFALLLRDYCMTGKNGMCFIKGTLPPNSKDIS